MVEELEAAEQLLRTAIIKKSGNLGRSEEPVLGHELDHLPIPRSKDEGPGLHPPESRQPLGTRLRARHGRHGTSL